MSEKGEFCQTEEVERWPESRVGELHSVNSSRLVWGGRALMLAIANGCRPPQVINPSFLSEATCGDFFDEQVAPDEDPEVSCLDCDEEGTASAVFTAKSDDCASESSYPTGTIDPVGNLTEATFIVYAGEDSTDMGLSGTWSGITIVEDGATVTVSASSYAWCDSRFGIITFENPLNDSGNADYHFVFSEREADLDECVGFAGEHACVEDQGYVDEDGNVVDVDFPKAQILEGALGKGSQEEALSGSFNELAWMMVNRVF